ncbi:MAG: GFA family protein [Devosia sp.]
MSHLVSCHCGRIRLEVDAELDEVAECNCSICKRSGFLHWHVPPERVKYLSEKQGVSTYWWRSATGGQHFCSNCGIAVVRISTQHPPVAINARCIEGIDVATLKVRQFDGRKTN